MGHCLDCGWGEGDTGLGGEVGVTVCWVTVWTVGGVGLTLRN